MTNHTAVGGVGLELCDEEMDYKLKAGSAVYPEERQQSSNNNWYLSKSDSFAPEGALERARSDRAPESSQ